VGNLVGFLVFGLFLAFLGGFINDSEKIMQDQIAKRMGFEIRKHRYGNGILYGWEKNGRMFVPGIKTLLEESPGFDLLMTGWMLFLCLGWTTIELFKRVLNKHSF
jgi:hypothetical protein